MPLLLAALALLLALPAGASARAPWRWPVRGRTVVRTFLRLPDRFAPGQRRVVGLAAAPGTPVRAVCGGRVTWAGHAPGSGLGLAVACGDLSATLTRLGSLAARRGAFVVPGQLVGFAGAPGEVRFGARVRGRPDGYRDPLTLLGAPPPPPLGPAPAPRVRGGRDRLPRPPLIPAAPAPARPVAADPVPGHALPLGLGLLGAAGLWGAAGLARRRRRAPASEGRGAVSEPARQVLRGAG